MAILSCAGPSNALDLLAWYALAHGTLIIICLSKIVTTNRRLIGYTILILGLWISHGFYLHHLDNLPELAINSDPKASNEGSKSQENHLHYATDFSVAAFVQDLTIFIMALVVPGHMLVVSWYRVWKGVHIAPWKRETMEKSAKRSHPVKSILKVCRRVPVEVDSS